LVDRNREHWENERNWKLNSIYVCKDDSRLVVPKKRRWAGWTFNFAHRGAYILLVYVLFVAVAPSMVVVARGEVSKIGYAVGLSAVLAAVAVIWSARIE
jgi:uncharacterized membrane protein